MSLVSKNNPHNFWQPTTSLKALQARAALLDLIRGFFKSRQVLEVETPLLCKTAATDPYIQAIQAQISYSSAHQEKFYLQTSPEFAMKRLLASGSGPIFQLCKAFRNDEVGRFHNPEFTILEWYRPLFDHHQLMDEMDALLSLVLNVPRSERISYQDLFMRHFNFNPHTIPLKDLQACVSQAAIQMTTDDAIMTRDDWLNILMTHCIEPHLGFDAPCMIFDYPQSQAALAKIRQEEIPVAERFEVYVRGVELANGYHELTDAKLQLERFQQDLHHRTQSGLSSMPLDLCLLEALKVGLPDCAGVALGFDRLLMLQMNVQNLREVISFTIDRA